MFKVKYNGRTFSSSRALVDAMQRDMQNAIERKIRNAAASSGLTVHKKQSGYEVSGDAEKLGRFYSRLGR